jgi:carboxyl-terminal processing protease
MRHTRFSVAAGLLTALIACSTATVAQEIDEASVSETEAEQAPHSEAGTPTTFSLEELQMFADVFNQIRRGYVEEVDDSTLFEYAVQGMLQGLDPHSVYLVDDDYDDLQTTTQGEFSGLGIEIGREGSYIKIIAPIDGSPAAEAGIQAGDIILELDGTSIKDMSLNDAVDTMRGPKGSTIELLIGRAGESQPLEFTVTRDIIKVASVRSRWLTPGYAYVRIAQFQRNTGADVLAEINARQEEGRIEGLVLDLRNNPGGVLGASVDVAGAFLDGGLVVYTDGRHAKSDEQFMAEAGDLLDGAPVVVLINGGSASASEIVAGALQDRRRGIIMGTRSFGKGSVQTVLPISDTRAIKLTTALYYTPEGRSIQAEGIVPDIVVERAKVTSLENGRRTKESDLSGRLDSATPGQADSTSEELSELASRDNQLYEALTLLRGINLLRPKREEGKITAE